jgi:hypothetical protein
MAPAGALKKKDKQSKAGPEKEKGKTSPFYIHPGLVRKILKQKGIKKMGRDTAKVFSSSLDYVAIEIIDMFLQKHQNETHARLTSSSLGYVCKDDSIFNELLKGVQWIGAAQRPWHNGHPLGLSKKTKSKKKPLMITA